MSGPERAIELHRLDGGTLTIKHATEMAQAFFRLDLSARGPGAYDAQIIHSRIGW